jgi:hypothetical protein
MCQASVTPTGSSHRSSEFIWFNALWSTLRTGSLKQSPTTQGKYKRTRKNEVQWDWPKKRQKNSLKTYHLCSCLSIVPHVAQAKSAHSALTNGPKVVFNKDVRVCDVCGLPMWGQGLPFNASENPWLRQSQPQDFEPQAWLRVKKAHATAKTERLKVSAS